MASTSASPSTPNVANAFEGIAPPYGSSSSSKQPWDVFINHCGTDVKHTLATNISNTLNRTGLRVFLDVEALQAGDIITTEIQEAMHSVSVHIAIFSPNYAQSPWCLAELSYMLKTNAKIIPVFRDVDPSDLRRVAHGKGSYASAFDEYEEKKRYTEEKLQEWKTALENVSLHSGFVVRNNHDEGKVLKNIENTVFKMMRKVPFEVAKRPVGLDRMVREFKRCSLESATSDSNVRIVGIVGMGGIGKTTLAKELYNQKCSCFHACSFIFDVREAASKSALHEKQKRLLKDIGVNNGDFCCDSVEEGKAILASRLRSLCALIVLDDVGHEDQLDALLPGRDALGSGSLIIVTSRELGVLTKWGISSNAICILKGFNESHARQLFCWHAFLQPYPEEGFEDLVQKFLIACSGLPLSLKVLGGQLYTKSMDYWEAQLQKISGMLPRDIMMKLKVSYDALDKDEQEMFMDVACFFIGENISLAIAVWDGSGWNGLLGWETLVNKCLVNLDEHDCITMHDHLRDLGRNLANNHSPSRLWHQAQIIKVQGQARESMYIRGVKFSVASSSFKEFRRPLPSSLGLKLLVDSKYEFTKQIVTPSDNLLWLRGIDFQIIRLPSWLSLRKLRILELKDANKLEKLWHNRDPPFYLRELTITGAHNFQKFPKSIGCLKDLKKIIVICSIMKNLPEEFCFLKSLEHLELVECRELSSLPCHLGDLKKLRHISLASCKGLTSLPDSFKHLIHLQYLNLRGCSAISFKLDMLENMRRLEYVDFRRCPKLKELPNQITDQVGLRVLDVQFTGLREVATDIGQLLKLESLKIGSPDLKSLPDSMWHLNMLRKIDISVTQVSTISIPKECCPSLEQLRLSGNGQLKHIGSLPTSMKTLLVVYCKRLKSITSCSGLVKLRHLCLVKCSELSELPSFAECLSLYKIFIDGCDKVKKLEGLEHAISLQELIAMTRWKSQGIQSLDCLERLNTLKLIARSRSALQPCIQTIKKWPREVLIGGRAVSDVESVMESLSLPNLTVIRRGKWWLEDWWKTHTSNADAAIICFLRYYSKEFVHNHPEVWDSERLNSLYRGSLLEVHRREGKWVYVGLFIRASNLISNTMCSRGFNLMNDDMNSHSGLSSERIMLVVGEETCVVEALTHFWNLFM
ncbi:hypothetical protein SUGI_0128910 [Cryptomeria japonica]|nr:hypothetical protein SUGI_0128910 [Cryptomeria japonica]